jgi:hypothetical protein
MKRTPRIGLLIPVMLILCAPLEAQVTLIDPAAEGGFEIGTTFDENGWTVVNGTKNLWYVGTIASGYSGSSCAAVSKDGSTYSYVKTSAVVNHFYRDIAFPPGYTQANLSFKWKATGESSYDMLKIYLTSTSTTPAAGSQISSGLLGTYNLGGSSWVTENISLCATAGTTQRLIFSWINDASLGSDPPIAVDSISLLVSSGSSCQTALGSGVTSVTTLPYSSGPGTTQGAANDLTSANTYSCGSASYLGGEDQVWIFTPTVDGQITISLTSSGSYTGLMLYSACPLSSLCGNAPAPCVAYSQSSTGSKSICTTVLGGVTYYLVLDSWPSPTYNSYSDLSITAPNPSGAVNDLPCNATALTLGVNTSGDNSCAGSLNEPAAPSCWTNGTLNTLWYSVTCPASGQLKILTTLGTLTDTQIGLYSGNNCDSLSTQSGWCNNNAPNCGTNTYKNSQLTVTSGLTPGETYYLAVDGVGTEVGTFDILVIDGTQPLPVIIGQECSDPNPVCDQNISVGNPGYYGYGNVCDFGTSYCLASGERGSVFYEIVISADGTLDFDIVPNDWPGAPSTTSTDYDFAVWKTGGSGAVTCAEIAGGTAPPIRCNYDAKGVTGCYVGGNAPASYPGFNSAYETSITVVTGDTYLLAVSNYSNSTSGFSLNFSASSPISYQNATQVVWTGGSNTTWTLTSNWGGCTSPTCSVDGIVSAAAFNQPVLSAGSYSVRNLTINSGASLTLQSGAVLHICGDYTNSGSLIAAAGSSVIFDGTGTQNMYGAMTGSDAISNLTITKSSGSVILHAPLDISETFTTSSSTSIFDVNGQYISLGGDFMNASGGTTFTNTGGSTLEFNGSADQDYSPGGMLSLENVVVNQPVTSAVLLVGSDMQVAGSGSLQLNSGRITTGSYEVNMLNSSATCVSGANSNSYVDGNLRRAVEATGSYDFPVGDYSSGKGYQLANIEFTAGNNATSLVARFDDYASVPGALYVIDCGKNYNMPALDNGYWTISSTPANSTGTYTATLYNTPGTFTNNGGATEWTLMKKPDAGTWGLFGNCASSSVNQVVRTDMTGFSEFGTAQSMIILPIELVSFTGQVTADGNLIEWETSSELNNDYFEVERSDDGEHFLPISTVSGHNNSIESHTYQFIDREFRAGNNFYRLKQVGLNNEINYSHIILLENALHGLFVSGIAPIPARDVLSVFLDLQESSEVLFTVTDLSGVELINFAAPLPSGRSEFHLDIRRLAKGIYLLRTELSNHRSVSINKIVIE